MNRLAEILKQWPLHLILLPFFFICHKYFRFTELLDNSEIAIAFLKIIVGITIFSLLLNWLLKPYSKAAIISTFAGTMILFFGDIKYSLSRLPVIEHISHYKIFVPLTLSISALVVYKLWRSQKLKKTTAFLNILFFLYLGLDFYIYFFHTPNKIITISSTPPLPINTQTTKDKNSFPDIYYILTDCYPSGSYQQEMLGISGNYLETTLFNKGFYIVNNSTSNYNKTAFSMASTFGMDYFNGTDSAYQVTPFDYNEAMGLVKKAPIFSFFKKNNYSLYNLSIFDLPDQPALQKEFFLTTSTTELIFYNTFWNCVLRDILPQAIPSYFDIMKKAENIKIQKKQSVKKTYNKTLLDSLAKFPESVKYKSPLFIYAHLGMPHFPYFYDSVGKAYPNEVIFNDSMITDKNKFANYIVYTNHKLEELVSGLLKKTEGKAVIIIQSDHGVGDFDWSRKKDGFRNISAFYFPDKDYHLLYPKMSNVNTFRILLNKYMGQQLPLLKDSTIFLID